MYGSFSTYWSTKSSSFLIIKKFIMVVLTFLSSVHCTNWYEKNKEGNKEIKKKKKS